MMDEPRQTNEFLRLLREYKKGDNNLELLDYRRNEINQARRDGRTDVIQELEEVRENIKDKQSEMYSFIDKIIIELSHRWDEELSESKPEKEIPRRVKYDFRADQIGGSIICINPECEGEQIRYTLYDDHTWDERCIKCGARSPKEADSGRRE